jgi:hypothetical protein
MVFEAFENVLNDLKNSGILERRPPLRRAAPRWSNNANRSALIQLW